MKVNKNKANRIESILYNSIGILLDERERIVQRTTSCVSNDFISCNSIFDYVVAHVSGVYFYVCMRRPAIPPILLIFCTHFTIDICNKIDHSFHLEWNIVCAQLLAPSSSSCFWTLGPVFKIHINLLSCSCIYTYSRSINWIYIHMCVCFDFDRNFMCLIKANLYPAKTILDHFAFDSTDLAVAELVLLCLLVLCSRTFKPIWTAHSIAFRTPFAKALCCRFCRFFMDIRWFYRRCMYVHVCGYARYFVARLGPNLLLFFSLAHCI